MYGQNKSKTSQKDYSQKTVNYNSVFKIKLYAILTFYLPFGASGNGVMKVYMPGRGTANGHMKTYIAVPRAINQGFKIKIGL